MMEAAYGQLDRWKDSARTDEAQMRELAAHIELRGQADDEIATRASYLDLLAITPGQRVLEVGCGSGVVLRDVARRVAPTGVAVGLDPSPTILGIAWHLAEQDGLADSIELREGDARALPMGDGEFDVVLAITVLGHVPQAEQVILELVRVARPGGRIGVLDNDADSLIIAHPDRVLTRRIVAARSDYDFTNGWIARQLPGLLAQAGLREVKVRAFASLERGPSTFFARVAERAADIALHTGVISEREQRSWLETVRAEQAAGRFIAGQSFIFAWGIRPDERRRAS